MNLDLVRFIDAQGLSEPVDEGRTIEEIKTAFWALYYTDIGLLESFVAELIDIKPIVLVVDGVDLLRVVLAILAEV